MECECCHTMISCTVEPVITRSTDLRIIVAQNAGVNLIHSIQTRLLSTIHSYLLMSRYAWAFSRS